VSDKSAIEWTDATWNPTTGCTKVSPGCANCYIETTTTFRVQGRKFVAGAIPMRLHHGRLEQPLRWKKGKRIFVNSLSDLFHEDIPDEFIDRVFAIMAVTGQHIYQVLTKRPVRMLAYLTARAKSAQPWKDAARTFGHALEFDGISLVSFPLPNVWLGVSVENQHFADERIPLLLQTPAAVRFISAEPLLGPVDLCFSEQFIGPCEECGDKDSSCDVCGGMRGLDWVIVGGESGPGARNFNIRWAHSILAQCRAAGVPVFVKQLGAHPFEQYEENGGTFTNPMLGADRLKDRKGGDPAEWPEDLRVREFPEPRA
jgi:protein gp37